MRRVCTKNSKDRKLSAIFTLILCSNPYFHYFQFFLHFPYFLSFLILWIHAANVRGKILKIAIGSGAPLVLNMWIAWPIRSNDM